MARRAVSGETGKTPAAVPGEGQGQGEVDRGLGPLEAPVPAGGLVGDGFADAVAAQAGKEASRPRRGGTGATLRSLARASVHAAGVRYRRAGGRGGADWLPGGVDRPAGQEPGTGLAGEVDGEERKAAAARAGLCR